MPYIGNPAVVGDSTRNFKLLDDIESYTLTFDATSTDIVSVANDTLTFSNHRFVTGQRVTYTDGGGTAIGGLTDNTAYYIIKVDQSTIKLATSSGNASTGTAINLTGVGVGNSHTLNIAFDGINTKFKATYGNGTKAGISRAGQLSISINGVIQQPQDSSSPTVGYGVEADSTLVFSVAPSVGSKVFGTFIGETAASFDLTDNTIDNFTGDGSTTIFNLSKEAPSSQDVLVTLDGVTQYPSDTSTTRSYSVIDQALTFVSAPATGVAIQARHIGFAGATTSAVTGFYGRTGNAVLASTDDISVQNISAGIATFTGAITVGGDLNVSGDLTYDEVVGRNLNITGVATVASGIVSTGDFKVGSATTISQDNIWHSGIITATKFVGANAEVSGDLSGATGTFTSDVRIADKILHTGDTDTTIRFPAADTITAETGGSERVRILSGGGVGIGTTAARGATLEVQDIGGTGPCLLLAGATSTEGDIVVPDGQDINIGHWNNVDTFTQRVRITSGGKVGINRSSVDGMLSVANTEGSISATETLCGEFRRDDGTRNPRFQILHNYDGSILKHTHSTTAGNLMFKIASDEVMRINSSGKVGIGTTNPQEELTITSTNPAVRLNDSDNYHRVVSSSEQLTLECDTGDERAGSYIAFRVDGANDRCRVTQYGLTPNPNDTAQANALDDYEQGDITTWRLIKNGAASNGSNTADTKVTYTKIGDMVTISGWIRTNSTESSQSGNAKLVTVADTSVAATLPYTPNHSGGLVVTHTRTLDVDDNHTVSLGFQKDNSTIYIYMNDAVGDYTPTQNNLGCNTQTNLCITFNGVYRTNG